MNVTLYLLKDFWYLFADDDKHGVRTLRIDVKTEKLKNLSQ